MSGFHNKSSSILTNTTSSYKDASKYLRNQLNLQYVIVPKICDRVDLERYFILAKRSYEQAVASLRQHPDQLYLAYIDFKKFLVLSVERIPTHPNYKTIQSKGDHKLIEYKKWMEDTRVKALSDLEGIVNCMDQTEYAKHAKFDDAFLEEQFEEECVIGTSNNPSSSSTLSATDTSNQSGLYSIDNFLVHAPASTSRVGDPFGNLVEPSTAVPTVLPVIPSSIMTSPKVRDTTKWDILRNPCDREPSVPTDISTPTTVSSSSSSAITATSSRKTFLKDVLIYPE
jgi:hypothetical protein